ncbi:MAG: IS30 family transposase [Anaerolineae bacterium]|nr:MAG: IS30 family transposase [Anaerolineae bacterium]
MSYTQLAQGQRYQIYALRKHGHSQTEIAAFLGVDKATISRELRRNRGQRGYRPKQAQRLAEERRQGGQVWITPEIWQQVEAKLRADWSPEQVSIWLREQGKPLSHERIYQLIYADKRAGGDLHTHLRCQKKYRKRYGHYDRRGKIPAQISIEQRPAVVAERTRLGDWEVDLMIGKGHSGALVTLTERKSRFTLIRGVAAKTAEQVTRAVLDLLSGVAHRETITADNGREFAAHQTIAAGLNIDFYFAHPYASWERGTNENTNGLIRQYLPKSRDLSTLTTQEELFIMDRLNLRPRKCLGFRTPFEVFFELQPVALHS